MKLLLHRPVATAIFLTLLLALGVIGWRLAHLSASFPEQRTSSLWPANAGPVDPALCGPLGTPRMPPPVNTPFGLHLYATTPLGVVRPLNAMRMVGCLGLAHTNSPATGLTAPDKNTDEPPLPRNETALDDVQTVVLLLEEYRKAFGAMPVGELNDEIVRRLQGENPLGIAVLPKSHPSISAQGELLDRWGTPYRFHPDSAWSMTVRSAGPDGKMWSNDDIISEHNTPDLVQR
jgi:hypothetical protein